MTPAEVRRRERARTATAWVIALGMGLIVTFGAVPVGVFQ